MRWAAPLPCLPLLCLLAVGCSRVGEPCVQPPDPPPILELRGAVFVNGDTPVRPRGVNSYPLLDLAGRGRWDDVAAILETARDLGRPLVRTGAYMTGGSNPGRLRDADGTLREEGLVTLDRLLEMAGQHQVQLLLIMSNHWPNYGGAPAIVQAVAPGEDLPVDAFYSDPRAIMHQQAFLRAVASRENTVTGALYANDPTIFAWELVNEARCDSAEFCDASTLPRWAQTMGETLRETGTTRPIAWGGQGYIDAHGERLADIAAVDAIDIVTFHLYPDLAGALTLGTSGIDRVTRAALQGAEHIRAVARVVVTTGKPLLIEEAGWRADGPDRDEERAIVLGAWSRAAFADGAGFFPWMIAEPGRPDYDGYLIRPSEEPAMDRVLRCQ
ncbi:MAG TPA: hypothetical protein ENK57_18715 [Polyangiaceae bacterium]|nr:hypothetical protein [Polyangiaceae bacterium]